jgi:hypothetical protein
MFVCVSCVDSGLGDELVIRSGETYRVYVREGERERERERERPQKRGVLGPIWAVAQQK